jgi:hypothetical protein
VKLSITPEDTAINDPRPSNPVVPVRLSLEDKFRFRCHPGIACFNECCRNIDILLTPYDVLRLARRLGLTTREFLAKHAAMYEMDAHGMPGLKMKTKPETRECQFLTEKGCGVYEDRPAACRYYPLGATTMRPKDSSQVEEFYFVVKEPHCLGHDEPRTQTVAAYRCDQGVEMHDEMTREWRDIVLKKRSSGPTVGRPSDRSFDLFFVASYDLDSFRDFVGGASFLDCYELPPGQLEKLQTDDIELMRFAHRFLKQSLFGERFLEEKPGAVERRIARRQQIMERERARMRAEMDKEHDSADEGPSGAL